MKTGICFIFVIPLLWFNLAMAASDLKVVVSIKPFHSLVSTVMQGVSEPALLLSGNNSPHTYSLRPSAAVKLQNADLVFGEEKIWKDFWPNQFILWLQEPGWFHLKIHRDSYYGPFAQVKSGRNLILNLKMIKTN